MNWLGLATAAAVRLAAVNGVRNREQRAGFALPEEPGYARVRRWRAMFTRSDRRRRFSTST